MISRPHSTVEEDVDAIVEDDSVLIFLEVLLLGFIFAFLLTFYLSLNDSVYSLVVCSLYFSHNLRIKFWVELSVSIIIYY